MNSSAEYLPWHIPLWNKLNRAIQGNQLAHALLLHGPVGIGKQQFAERLAQILVCQSPTTSEYLLTACGQCTPCKQYAEDGEHADIHRLSPEEPAREIKIEQARAAIDFANQTAHYGGRKVILINPVDKLNNNAANALLKTLEEPPKDTIQLLLSEQPARLLPTIRSRCLQLRFAMPGREEALNWLNGQGIEQPEQALEEANGAPLQALEVAREGRGQWRQERDVELLRLIKDQRSPSRLAQHWQQFDAHDIYSWLYDRLRRIQWRENGLAKLTDTSPELKEISASLSLRSSKELTQQLNVMSRSDLSRVNRQLCTESLLFSIMKAAINN